MKMSIYLTALSEAHLNADSKDFKKGVDSGTKEAIKMLETDAKRFGGPNSLKTRSGYLKNSIKSSFKSSSDEASGTLGSDAVYAAIHEFGGVITSSAKQYLQFQGDYGWVSVSSVVIPKRPFLKPAIERNINTMRSEIIKHIDKEM